MVSFHQVQKSFGSVHAVRGLDIEVAKGELFGMIGPDGAGKSTAMRMLVTLVLPDAGTITVNGLDAVKDFRELRRQVGYMPGNFSLYRDLTVEENLDFFARVFSTTIQENYDLIKPIYEQLAPFKKRLAGALSGGMKQKLALCCALIHKPVLLVLDEPTTGVDAVSRREFWEILNELRANEMTIIVSTPYLEEASLCERVGLINDGRLLQVGTPQEIIQSYTKSLWSVRAADNNAALTVLRTLPSVEAVYPYRDVVRVSTGSGVTKDMLMSFLRENGLQNAVVTEAQAEFEDCFMDLMLEPTNA